MADRGPVNLHKAAGLFANLAGMDRRCNNVISVGNSLVLTWRLAWILAVGVLFANFPIARGQQTIRIVVDREYYDVDGFRLEQLQSGISPAADSLEPVAAMSREPIGQTVRAATTSAKRFTRTKVRSVRRGRV